MFLLNRLDSFTNDFLICHLAANYEAIHRTLSLNLEWVFAFNRAVSVLFQLLWFPCSYVLFTSCFHAVTNNYVADTTPPLPR
jgi:hypothetical protein